MDDDLSTIGRVDRRRETRIGTKSVCAVVHVQRAFELAALRPREPAPLVPEERTPLPQVDQALPVLRLFPAIVGRGERGRYRVALLKTLAGAGAGRWKIRQF